MKYGWDRWLNGDLFQHAFDDVDLLPGFFSSKMLNLTRSRTSCAVFDDKGMTFEDELPGVAPADVEVFAQDDVLTITWKKGEKKGEHRYTIAPDYDAATAIASMRDGMLTVRIPRASLARSKKVQIKVE